MPGVNFEYDEAHKTLYTANIPLGYKYEDLKRDPEVEEGGPMTAIYLPPGVSTKAAKVNVLLWLHGHKETKTKNLPLYLTDPRFRLRQHMRLVANRRLFGIPDGDEAEFQFAPNVVFVAPMMGFSNESGTLSTAPKDYLNKVKQEMASHLSFSPSLKWSEMVLACHSGGGKPAKLIVDELATMMKAEGGKLAEVWHFDSLYENDEPLGKEYTSTWWATWASAHPETLIKVFYFGTAEHSKNLKSVADARGLKNVRVQPSAKQNHDTVPRVHFRDCYEEWLSSMSPAAQRP